jgi:hypothetical protein
MTDHTQHEDGNAHGSFEQQDLSPRTLLYFLSGLGIAIILSIVLLRGFYMFLDKRERALQPPVSPLVTKVPEDTRHIAPGYPQTAFPEPRLEDDERTQLNGIRLKEEQTLYSYGWVDQRAGTIHIPIDRAMDLLVQRGLPVRPQASTSNNESGNPAAPEPNKKK